MKEETLVDVVVCVAGTGMDADSVVWSSTVAHVMGYLLVCCWQDSDITRGSRSGYGLPFQRCFITSIL